MGKMGSRAQKILVKVKGIAGQGSPGSLEIGGDRLLSNQRISDGIFRVLTEKASKWMGSFLPWKALFAGSARQ